MVKGCIVIVRAGTDKGDDTEHSRMEYYGICSIGAELVCVGDTLTTWGYAVQCRALTDRCLLSKAIRNPIGCIRSETLGKKKEVSLDTAEGGRRHIPSEHRAWETQHCHGGFSAPGRENWNI